MQHASEEMNRLAAMIASEVAEWPGVSVRPMFGMRLLYRDAAIFGALPATRTLGTPRSISLRFDPMPPELARRARADERIAFDQPGARWYSFELTSVDQLRDALWWLNQAWAAAPRTMPRRKPRRRGAAR